MNTYLVTFLFISGEHSVSFHRVFEVETEDELKKSIDNYLRRCYSHAKKEGEGLYFYDGGKIIIELSNYKKITGLGMVRDMLMIDIIE